MLASLPMYDLPEIRRATDAWWRGLAAAFRRAGIEDVPDRLTRGAETAAAWYDPGLLFSQTCGYPLVHKLSGVLQPVATPVYDAPGCVGPRYRSAIVIRADNSAGSLVALRGGVCAFNGRDSQSGYHSFRTLLAPLVNAGRFFRRVVESGSHVASLALVASGGADVCAIDCVTCALIARYRPWALARTRVLGHTQAAPGLPYVTPAVASPDLVHRLRDGLMAALADPALTGVREALLLTGAEVLSAGTYAGIPKRDVTAGAEGCPELR